MTSPARSLVTLLGLVILAAPAAAQDDGSLREAWSRLSADEQGDLAARFEAEVAALDSLQNRLSKRARALEPGDPAGFPEYEPAPYYEPAVHAPDLPIPRVRLAQDSRAAREVRRDMFAKFTPRRLRTAWRYDWGSGRVVRTADPRDPEHVFENALFGNPPDADLAEALIERALDDGAQREALRAFAHAYTDRDGRVYPVTLYDAWCSGLELEMPDIDNLGIVHDLLDDWTRWTSPVPESRQKSLYRTVEGLFEAPRRHRALRTALARTYLVGEADLRDGFEPRKDHLHAFWLRHEDSPEKARAALPAPPDDEYFMADWGLEVEEDLALRTAAEERRVQLHRDAWEVRGLMIRLLEEAGATAREAATREGE